MRGPLTSLLLLAVLACSPAPGAVTAVSRLQVRISTGARELTAGSAIELRIYEAGRNVRRLPLSHGEAWPSDTIRTIPLTLAEPLDPRTVSRFALYYRAASPLSPPWEVVSAEVDFDSASGAQERLLNATLSGVIAQRGELASTERDPATMRCASDADCDDHLNCNGRERCVPQDRDADARGCVKGMPVACPVNQVCTERHGCRGPDNAAPAPASAAPTP